MIDSIPEVIAFAEAQLEEMGCPARSRVHIDIAIDEIFANIAMYAYAQAGGMATVRVEELCAPRRVVVTFIDQGTPYNPLARQEPDITLAAEDRPIGGLGVLMVRRSMDDVAYEYRDGSNVFSITKLLPQ